MAYEDQQNQTGCSREAAFGQVEMLHSVQWRAELVGTNLHHENTHTVRSYYIFQVCFKSNTISYLLPTDEQASVMVQTYTHALMQVKLFVFFLYCKPQTLVASGVCHCVLVCQLH